MKLMTDELKKSFEKRPIGSTDGKGNDRIKIIAKYFHLWSRYTFYATEGEMRDDDYIFFGYCKSPLGADCDELGYVLLSQLKSVNGMERDLYFKGKTLADVMNTEEIL